MKNTRKVSLTLACTTSALTTLTMSLAPIGAAHAAPITDVLVDSGGGINGGAIAPGWAGDQSFSGGDVNAFASVRTSGVTNAANPQVYKTVRYGTWFSYTAVGFDPGKTYTVRLHLVDPVSWGKGQNVFDVWGNGAHLLASEDVYAEAGSARALVKDASVTADANGQISLGFVASKGYAAVAGIELHEKTSSTPAPAPTTPKPTPATPEAFGLSVPGTGLAYDGDASLEDSMTQTAASGAGWIRFDIPMAQVENPVTCAYDWSHVDKIVDSAAKHHLKMLGIVDTIVQRNPYGGKSCNGAPSTGDWKQGVNDDAGRTAYASFAQAVATRYKGKIAAYEVWNEPNLTGFWNPAPSASSYASLLKVAYPALKKGDPSAIVVSGGLGGASQPGDISSVDFVKGFYAAGAKGSMDAVGMHPYSDATLGGEMTQVPLVRTLMTNAGEAHKPIWATETGNTTGGSWSISETDQAASAKAVISHWRQVPDHGPLFWYTLRDFPVASGQADDRENHFGILRTDGSRKPVFAVLRSLAGLG